MRVRDDAAQVQKEVKPKAVTAKRCMTRSELWQSICGSFLYAPAPTQAIWLEALRRGTLRRKHPVITGKRLDALEHVVSRVLRGEVRNADQATVAEAHRLQARISAIPFLVRTDPRLHGFHMVDLGEQSKSLEQAGLHDVANT